METTVRNRQPHRFEELDVLRGCCALAVVLYHYAVRFDALVGFSGTPNPAMDIAYGDVRQWGMTPVYVFFMISGFVIPMTLDRCRTVGEFALSRFSRVFPAYWVAVAITYMAWEIHPVFLHHVEFGQAVFNLTMLQGLFYVPDVDGVYWSLTAELAFYFTIATIFVCDGLRYLREICWGWLMLALAVQAFGIPVPHRIVLLLNLDYAQFFVAGIVFHQIWRRTAIGFDACLLLGCATAIALRYPLGPTSCLLSVMGLMILMASGGLQWIVLRPLLFLGSISYSLYLTHQMIGYQVLAALPLPAPCRVLVTTAGAILLATAVTFGIERPAQRILRTRLPGALSQLGLTLRPWRILPPLSVEPQPKDVR